MQFRKVILILMLSLLTSCVGFFLAGLVGGVVVYDNRSVTAMERDTRIFFIVNSSIARDPTFEGSRVVITSFNKVVLLLGEVQSASVKEKAEKIAKDAKYVTRVYNQITVGPKIPLSQQSKDTWITGEIKAKMLGKKDLESGSIRVITEDSAVYLMGVVTKDQADLAVDVARKVKGVRKVVKIFQYIQ